MFFYVVAVVVAAGLPTGPERYYKPALFLCRPAIFVVLCVPIGMPRCPATSGPTAGISGLIEEGCASRIGLCTVQKT